MNENLQPSDALCQFTKRSETFSPESYPDAGGYSIGYGHHDPSILAGMTWTLAQADDQFAVDMAAKAALVRQHVTVALTQGQFDCLCDFFYNVKLTSILAAPAHTLSTINAGDFAAVPDLLYRKDADGTEHGWIFSEGVAVAGLVARRQGEIAFWNGTAEAAPAPAALEATE
jgi:GH24 family phage-related lysozyme (muramidase)